MDVLTISEIIFFFSASIAIILAIVMLIMLLVLMVKIKNTVAGVKIKVDGFMDNITKKIVSNMRFSDLISMFFRKKRS